MKKIYELKALIKTFVELQRELRSQRSSNFQGQNTIKESFPLLTSSGCWTKQKVFEFEKPHDVAAFRMRSNKYTLRHLHIAYCLLRGRTMEEIEPKVSDNNAPNLGLVNKLMEQYKEVENEALCVVA